VGDGLPDDVVDLDKPIKENLINLSAAKMLRYRIWLFAF